MAVGIQTYQRVAADWVWKYSRKLRPRNCHCHIRAVLVTRTCCESIHYESSLSRSDRGQHAFVMLYSRVRLEDCDAQGGLAHEPYKS